MTLPTVKVELGRLTGWTLGASLLGTSTYLATYTYSDITSRVMDFSVRRGRQHELDRIEAGTASLTLINQDGAFTPTNTSSTYYPDIRPMAPIRVTTAIPPGIPGLRIWADVSQMPVVADGTAIGSFTDFSGNGNHFTQGTGANQPTYQSNIFNGHPVLRFDGTNDSMSVTSAADASQTIFIVAQKRSAPAVADDTVFSIDEEMQLFADSAVHATGLNWHSNQAGGNTANVVPSVATKHAIVLRINSAASVDIWSDGGSATNLDPNNAATTSTARCLGADTNGPANFGDYDVAEYIEYDSALTSAQMNFIGNYLASEYGITWTAIP